MAILKQSTAYTRMILLVQTSDHITGLTGASPTVTLSKAGAAFGALGGSIAEVSSGWYKISLNTTDTGTLGDLAYHITAASGDPTDFVDQVCANILGDTLPANATQFAGQTITAAAGVTLPSSVASPTNITAGTITTTTNLTNAPTAGDFTAAMKTSLNAATPASVTGAVGSVTSGVTVTTNNDKTGYTASTVSDKTGYTLTNAGYAAVMTQQLTESYAALNAVPTPAQAILEIRAILAQNSISGTTMTVTKVDGSTTAETFTLNSATAPTSITRAS